MNTAGAALTLQNSSVISPMQILLTASSFRREQERPKSLPPAVLFKLFIIAAFALVSCGKEEDEAPTKQLRASANYEFGQVVSFAKGGGSETFKRSGWGESEQEFTWTTGQSAKLRFIPAAANEPLTLHARLAAFIKPPELTVQPVEVFVNDQKVADWEVSDAENFTALIPADVANRAELLIEFRTPRAASPKSLGVSTDPRLLGVSCYQLQIMKSG